MHWVSTALSLAVYSLLHYCAHIRPWLYFPMDMTFCLRLFQTSTSSPENAICSAANLGRFTINKRWLDPSRRQLSPIVAEFSQLRANHSHSFLQLLYDSFGDLKSCNGFMLIKNETKHFESLWQLVSIWHSCKSRERKMEMSDFK